MPPSFDEMKDALDLRSKSGIHRLIMALEERGFIRRLPNRARAIEVVRMPEQSVPGRRAARRVQPRTSSRAISARSGRKLPRRRRRSRRSSPSRSWAASRQARRSRPSRSRSHTISMPPDMLASGEHFALEVRGDSMVEAGILDGDTVVIRRQDIADTGDIIVALIDDEEATLKRLRRRGSSIALEAANPAYETRVLGPGPGAHPGQAREPAAQY